MIGHTLQQITPLTTNVPKTDYEAYNPEKVYAKAEICTVEEDGKNYYCTLNDIQGLTPKANLEIWDSEPMNYLRMFDYTNSGKTTNPESIEVTFKAINIDAISFFGLVAKEVEISMIDNDTNAQIYTKTFDLVEDELEDFADYLFSEQELQEKLSSIIPSETLDNVIAAMTQEQIVDRFTATPPIYYDTTVTIKIKNPGSIAECAFCTVGMQRDLGFTVRNSLSQNKSSINIDDRDRFGNINFKNALAFNTITAEVYTDMDFNILDKKLSKIQGKPFVFIPARGIYATNILGIYTELDTPVDPEDTSYTLEIKSLIRDYQND
ncbi:hypothetical protein [Halarcobacter sp.]|uniref:hypothetical protein n=1 Tax=Halarcobacter sp. TaxID=2321133 RepID=UPI0029F5AD28|nr:hypothetical protein [Halarcobacter sp.]